MIVYLKVKIDLFFSCFSKTKHFWNSKCCKSYIIPQKYLNDSHWNYTLVGTVLRNRNLIWTKLRGRRSAKCMSTTKHFHDRLATFLRTRGWSRAASVAGRVEMFSRMSCFSPFLHWNTFGIASDKSFGYWLQIVKFFYYNVIERLQRGLEVKSQ